MARSTCNLCAGTGGRVKQPPPPSEPKPKQSSNAGPSLKNQLLENNEDKSSKNKPGLISWDGKTTLTDYMLARGINPSVPYSVLELYYYWNTDSCTWNLKPQFVGYFDPRGVPHPHSHDKHRIKSIQLFVKTNYWITTFPVTAPPLSPFAKGVFLAKQQIDQWVQWCKQHSAGSAGATSNICNIFTLQSDRKVGQRKLKQQQASGQEEWVEAQTWLPKDTDSWTNDHQQMLHGNVRVCGLQVVPKPGRKVPVPPTSRPLASTGTHCITQSPSSALHARC